MLQCTGSDAGVSQVAVFCNIARKYYTFVLYYQFPTLSLYGDVAPLQRRIKGVDLVNSAKPLNQCRSLR